MIFTLYHGFHPPDCSFTDFIFKKQNNSDCNIKMADSDNAGLAFTILFFTYCVLPYLIIN